MSLDLKNFSIRPNSGVGKAQDFSSVSLGKESIKNAKISVSQNNNSRPSVSVFHPGGAGSGAVSSINSAVNSPVTSINNPVTDENTEEYNKLADDRRYNYMRRLMKWKRENEGGERQVGQVGPHDLKLRTGAGFRTTGMKSIRRQLSRLYKQAPATYRNLSVADRKYFAGLVSEHAGKVRLGKGISAPVRRKLKRQVNKDWKYNHIISKPDVNDFKKLINNLPH